MIPEEAVQAAAKGIWEARPMERVYEEGSPNYGAAKPWADIKQYQRDRCMTLARFALEAAAPYMLAAAFDQGQKSGMRHADRLVAAAKIGHPELPGPISPNPYMLNNEGEK